MAAGTATTSGMPIAVQVIDGELGRVGTDLVAGGWLIGPSLYQGARPERERRR